jgi:hypothetical protein
MRRSMAYRGDFQTLRPVIRKSISALMSVAASSVLLAACSSTSGSRNTNSAPAGTSTYRSLLTKNGLFADPSTFLAGSAPSLYSSAFSIELAASLNESPGTGSHVLTAPQISQLKSQIKVYNVIYGSFYLDVIGRSQSNRELELSAAAPLNGELTKYGYFSDLRGKASTSVPIQLGETTAALSVLSQSNSVNTARYSSIPKWLIEIEPDVSGNTFLTMELESDLALFNLHYRKQALMTASDWMNSNSNRIMNSSSISVDDVFDAFGTLSIFKVSNHPISSNDYRVFARIAQAATQSDDAQIVSMGAALTGGNGSPEIVRLFRNFLDSLRLGNGLFASPVQATGDLVSTFRVVTNPMFAGSPDEQARLYKSSLKVTYKAISQRNNSDCVVEVALAVALDHFDPPPSISSCANSYVATTVPHVVNITTAPRWFALAPYVTSSSLGRSELRTVVVLPWKTTTNLQSAEAVDASYVALVDSSVVPSLEGKFKWTVPADERILELGPSYLGTFFYFAAYSNLVQLGVAPTHSQKTQMSVVLESDEGCPGFSTFYRDTLANRNSCSLEVTGLANSVLALVKGSSQ